MDFVTAVKTCLQFKYATISGRAARSEYWFFYLFYIIGYIAAVIVDSVLGMPITTLIFLLGILVPFFCVTVRRFHDLDKSGWFMLIALIPIVGAILMLIWFCTKGTVGDNRFGPDPLAGVVTSA